MSIPCVETSAPLGWRWRYEVGQCYVNLARICLQRHHLAGIPCDDRPQRNSDSPLNGGTISALDVSVAVTRFSTGEPPWWRRAAWIV